MTRPRLTTLALPFQAFCCLAVLLGPLCAGATAGPKTDVVWLTNGDRITCEIKKLAQARLTLSTDPMDTVTVHWDSVVKILSPRQFEVEISSGVVYHGSLAEGPPGQVTIVTADGSGLALMLGLVVRMTPIGTSFWGRMDGNIDLGFSFTQASLETRWTLNASTTYRSRLYVFKGTLASALTARADADQLVRNTLTLSANRLLGRRWFTVALAQFQQNEELSLDLRALGGGGLGRYFSQTNGREIAGFAGLVYTRERFAGESPASSAEAAVGGTLDFFSARDNDFTFDNTVVSFYRLGSDSRARVELQSALRYEFYKDLYWSINGFESFDSDPPADEKRNDAGVSIALGWKF